MQIKYINCEYCGASIEGKAPNCPKCGGENKLSPMFIADEIDEQNTPAFTPEEIKRDEMRRKGIPTEEQKRAEAMGKEELKKKVQYLKIAGGVILLIALVELILFYCRG